MKSTGRYEGWRRRRNIVLVVGSREISGSTLTGGHKAHFTAEKAFYHLISSFLTSICITLKL